ncbi:restriction endonuclease subunit S [Nocardioides glacieisoli]|uniref:restriction endonuclease subunit S n=1 Tax=Nocardioides glacieisoli TaxID=1168730 RepID=UPI0024144115|nr:restriction endonuclease subunit S [Nocardioides glacieisoli]
MSWDVVELADVADVVRGVTYKREQARNEPGPGYCPLLRATNIGDALDLSGGLVYVPETVVKASQKLELGDIVLASSSGSLSVVGKSAILRQRWSGTFGAFCAVIRSSPRIDSRYLALYLRSPDVRSRWSEAARGTNINNLKRGDLAETPVPLPPLDEQLRIVDLLEDHLSRLDAAVRLLEDNRKRLALLLQAAIDNAFWKVTDPSALIFHAEVTSQRGSPTLKQKVSAASPDVELLPDELPWPVASLEQLTDPKRTIRYGILKPKVPGGTVPYVEVKDLRGHRLEATDLRLTSADLDAQYAAARLQPGDVVVAVRGSFERSAVVPSNLQGANMSRDVVRLAPQPGISPWYLHYWHQTSTSKRYLRRHARGVAVRGVNVGSLRAMPVPVLTPDVQTAVVRAITEQEIAIARLDHEIHVAHSRSSRLRRSLLAAAFSGQLIGGLHD